MLEFIEATQISTKFTTIRKEDADKLVQNVIEDSAKEVIRDDIKKKEDNKVGLTNGDHSTQHVQENIESNDSNYKSEDLPVNATPTEVDSESEGETRIEVNVEAPTDDEVDEDLQDDQDVDIPEESSESIPEAESDTPEEGDDIKEAIEETIETDEVNHIDSIHGVASPQAPEPMTVKDNESNEVEFRGSDDIKEAIEETIQTVDQGTGGENHIDPLHGVASPQAPETVTVEDNESVEVEFGGSDNEEGDDQDDSDAPPDDNADEISESDEIIAKEILDFINSPEAEEGSVTNVNDDLDSGTGEDKEPSLDENQEEPEAEPSDNDGDKDSANGPSEDPDNQTEEEIETKSEDDEEETIEERNESEEAEI